MTTSSISFISSSRMISMLFEVPIFTSFVCMPTEEKRSTGLGRLFTMIVYFPSASVATPMEVPLINTVAPGNGCPLASFTIPEILRASCCGRAFNTITSFFTLYVIPVPLRHSVNAFSSFRDFNSISIFPIRSRSFELYMNTMPVCCSISQIMSLSVTPFMDRLTLL